MLETNAPTQREIERENDVRNVARALYWQGWRVASIARHLGLKAATVSSWCRRDKWKEATAIERIEAAAETRLMVLIGKEKKDGADYKEIDLLGRQVERLARVRKYGAAVKSNGSRACANTARPGRKAI